MKLRIYVVGDSARIPDAKHIWEAFEKSVTLPFAYDKPADFHVCDDTAVSEIAEARVEHGVAEIKVTPLLLDSPRPDLTLLHESLHIASFIGPLQDLYATAKKLQGPTIGHALGRHLFEVDAEFALRDQFPDYAADRATHYVQDVEKKIGSLYSDLPADDPQRPYGVLYDQLRAELAGVLLRDVRVETRLSASLERSPEWCADDIEKLHGMLSPKSNDYADLPRWGAKTYETIISRVNDQLNTRDMLLWSEKRDRRV